MANDIVTQEDAERMKRSGLIDPARVSCGRDRGLSAHRHPRRPDAEHPGGRELGERFPRVEVVLVETGGDNLASTFSLELVDYWLFVIDGGRRRYSAKTRPRHAAVRSSGDQQDRSCALCRGEPRLMVERGERGPPRPPGHADQLQDRRRRGGGRGTSLEEVIFAG